MVGILNKFLVSALLLLTSATLVQAGTITYELKFSGADLYDYTDPFPIGTYSGGFTLSTTSPITSEGLYPITTSFLSTEAEALYNVLSLQLFAPNGFNTGKSFIGFNTENDDLSGSGTGNLFFESDAFTTNGVHQLSIGVFTNGVDFYGNFAAEATLTVSGIADISSVPEPSSIAIFGLLGLVTWRVSRRKPLQSN